jgi:hypothetical protein
VSGARATALAALLLAACGERKEGAALDREPSPGPSAGPAAPGPAAPAVSERDVARAGAQDLTSFGFPVTIEAPAGAKLSWMDGSPDTWAEAPDRPPKVATVRLIHGTDPDEVLFRERGVRLYLRRPVAGEATDLAAFKRVLEAMPARVQAELAALEGELEELEKGVRELQEATGTRPSPPTAEDRELEEMLAEESGPPRLIMGHERTTATGWETMWQLGEDEAFTLKVWRSDLGLFCTEVMASQAAAERALAACRTLAPVKSVGQRAPR